LRIQLLFNAAKKRIDLILVVTPLSNRRLGERHIANIRWRNTTPCRRISQRCRDALEVTVDLVFVVSGFFVVTALSPGRL
jgi:hypothetical protein